MRKKVLEQEFIRLNADYKALLDETIQLREKVATADEALEKMRATEENVRSIHENTRRLKHDMRNHLMVIAMSLGNEKYDEARTYTAQILDKLNLEYSYIDSGNALLNYILNLKLQQAQQMQVHMQLQEKHGMGIKQIRAIIEKYNGLLDIYEEDLVFCVNVMLPAG